jgi:hypothetical protein
MMQPTTWGAVDEGAIVRDKNDHLWIVGPTSYDEVKEYVLLTPAHGRGEPVLTTRPPGDRPVDTYVATEEEAVLLVEKELGGRILRDIEEREHTIARALNWRVDPVKRSLVALRDHIDWLHGFSVDDVLRKGTGTKINPATPAKKRASIEELCEAHDEAHARPDLWPHVMPHHHAKIGD